MGDHKRSKSYTARYTFIRTTASVSALYSSHLFLTMKYGALRNQTKTCDIFEVLMVVTMKITVIRDVMP